MDKEDKRLMNAIQAGEEKAFETLFFKYYEALCRFTCRYVDSMAIAEELVQEVYANLWEMHNQLEKLGNIRSYLYKAVKNQALDYLKHEEVVQKYETEVKLEFYEEVYEADREHITKEGFITAAQNAIEELPEHTRHIYKLSRKNGLTYREISDVLEISIKTVESHISKALRILRDRLVHYYPILLMSFLFYEFVG